MTIFGLLNVVHQTYAETAPIPTSLQSAVAQQEVWVNGLRYVVRVHLEPASGGTIVGAVNAPSDLALVWSTKDSIRLIWKDNSQNESQFSIFRRTEKTDWVRVAVVGPNGTTYTDRGLTENSEYFYRVRASNPQTGSEYSPVLICWTQFYPVSDSRREPTISEVLDTTGKVVTTLPPGAELTVVGQNFGPAGSLTYNHQVVPVTSWSDDHIKGVLTGFKPGTFPGVLMVWRNDGHYYSSFGFTLAGATPEPVPGPTPTPVPDPVPVPDPTPILPPDVTVPSVLAGLFLNGLPVKEALPGQVLQLSGTNLWYLGTSQTRLQLGTGPGSRIAAITRGTPDSIEFTLPAPAQALTGPLQLWWNPGTGWTKRGEIAGFTLKVPPP
jgi:hypothetical protein